MKSALLAAAIAATTMASASAAAAEPVNLSRMTLGYTYYNRPGADMAAHNRDLAVCLVEASKVRSLDEQLGSGAELGIVGALVGGALADAAHRGVMAASLENCMVVLGWRVVHLPDAEGAALAALPAADLAARLAPWVGAETPHGDVVRVWGNDAARGETVHFAIRPGHTNDGQLSLKAGTAETLKQVAADANAAKPAAPPTKPAPLDPRWQTKPLKPPQIASTPPDAAVIVVDIKNLSMRNGIGVLFMRQGPDSHTMASSIDHGPDVLLVALGLMFAKKDANIFAVAVPPGRWRVAGPLSGAMLLNFCLGSPAFDVRAGEVIYAGAFDLTGEAFGPDLALAPARAWLAGQPAADTIRAAVYTNGARGPCGPNNIYALEIPGAPFEPGYVWGGARSAPAAPAPSAPPPVRP